MKKPADIFLKFKLEPDYAGNYVHIAMFEHTKHKDEKWPCVRLMRRAKVKISGFFVSKETLGFRLSKKQREMVAEYKKNLKYYDAIDEYCQIAYLPNITVADVRTSELINRHDGR